MYHYTYIINYSNGMFYIGVRTCVCLPSEDPYLGSSKYTPNHLAIRKRILKIFPSREQAVAHETRWQRKLRVSTNPKFYNKAIQTSVKFDTTGVSFPRSAEHNQKIKEALTGRKRSPEECANISKGRYGKGIGRKHTQKAKDAVSKAKLGKPNPIPRYSYESRKKNYVSRTADNNKYHWVNTITGETAYETYTDMGYLHGAYSKTTKPPAPFRKMVQGKQKSYKGWQLNTGMN